MSFEIYLILNLINMGDLRSNFWFSYDKVFVIITIVFTVFTITVGGIFCRCSNFLRGIYVVRNVVPQRFWFWESKGKTYIYIEKIRSNFISNIFYCKMVLVCSYKYTNPLRMISASTITGIVKDTRLLETLMSCSGLELLTAISILIGLAFDSFNLSSFTPPPTTSGRMMVFKEI